MRRMILRTMFAFTALGLSLGAVAADSFPPQSSNRAGIAVKVAPKTLTGDLWEFEVTLDTHSQDLKDDLLKSAVLIADGGSPTAPAGWQGDPPGGHHRKGMLRFSAAEPSPRNIELRIQLSGESAPRSFLWSLR